jgi:hypothetical protein
LIRKALDKYSKESFEREVLFEYDNENDAKTKEREIVNEEFLKRKDIYNLALGGMLINFLLSNTIEGTAVIARSSSGHQIQKLLAICLSIVCILAVQYTTSNLYADFNQYFKIIVYLLPPLTTISITYLLSTFLPTTIGQNPMIISGLKHKGIKTDISRMMIVVIRFFVSISLGVYLVHPIVLDKLNLMNFQNDSIQAYAFRFMVTTTLSVILSSLITYPILFLQRKLTITLAHTMHLDKWSTR